MGALQSFGVSFSKSACARVFARARVTLKVRDDKIRLIERQHSKSLLHRVEDSFIENVRVSCMPGELVPIPESVSARLRCVGDIALVGMHSRCLYGFMRCKIIPCISSVVCSRYMFINYVNCPVSWCKPVGLAGVRTLNPCLMVRKDTNSKM